MTLAINELKVREGWRKSFAKEFIHQYKINSRLPKRDGIRVLVAARLAIAHELRAYGRYASPFRSDGIFDWQKNRDFERYPVETLGFKNHTELLRFCLDVWRNRVKYESATFIFY